MLGTKWASLAGSLSLGIHEIDEVRQKGQGHALHMLKMWALKKDSTYGKLLSALRTVSLDYAFLANGPEDDIVQNVVSRESPISDDDIIQSSARRPAHRERPSDSEDIIQRRGKSVAQEERSRVVKDALPKIVVPRDNVSCRI